MEHDPLFSQLQTIGEMYIVKSLLDIPLRIFVSLCACVNMTSYSIYSISKLRKNNISK